MELTQELVKELFDYHEDGYLIWKNPLKFSWVKPGRRAGNLYQYKKGPRYTIKIAGKTYIVSRVIFLWHKGYLPKVVDHKDRNTINDRIENLRPATDSENCKNRRGLKNASSKYKGVNLDGGKYWRAIIKAGDKKINLGNFKTEKEAAIAYNNAAQLHFGEFAYLNIFED